MKYLIILLLLLSSCEDKPNELEVLRAEMMKIHDESMEKMGEIRKSVYDLEDIAKESPDSNKIKVVILELESADEGMMMWMQEYKEPEESKLKEFYAVEKVRIEKVASNIYKSLKNASEYIDK